ncbi:cysteine protease Amb a 11.0101-like [Bidens hawaiensis]|uniref:cysteine protease Amb a 11.0101-like n=1 Tax=Bidens hawaiensis TaxID=980011 RepID=UPI004049AACF
MEISKSIILLLSLVLILGVVDSFDYHEKELESEEGLQGMYDRWRDHHKVTEKSHERFNVFKYNVHNIHKINKQNLPYKVEPNQFATLTLHEWSNIYANSKSEHFKALRGTLKPDNLTGTYSEIDINSLPRRIDWREHNAVVPVKSQGQCGSCFAFAAVGGIEGINAIRIGQLKSLSEQQVLDCDTLESRTSYCGGGIVCGVYQFVTEHGGIASDESYPYVGKKETCDKSKYGHHSVTLDGKEDIPKNDEAAVMKAVAHQPVTFSMDPMNDGFMFYKEGIYTGPCGLNVQHAMLHVGYDEAPDGTKYYIVRNSWGDSWGEKGYIRMQRGVANVEGLCNMYLDSTFPLKSFETRNVEL